MLRRVHFSLGWWRVLGVHLAPDILVFGPGFSYKLGYSGHLWPFLLINEHSSSPAVIEKKECAHRLGQPRAAPCQLTSGERDGWPALQEIEADARFLAYARGGMPTFMAPVAAGHEEQEQYKTCFPNFQICVKCVVIIKSVVTQILRP
jgi:hypothetical protein